MSGDTVDAAVPLTDAAVGAGFDELFFGRSAVAKLLTTVCPKGDFDTPKREEYGKACKIFCESAFESRVVGAMTISRTFARVTWRERNLRLRSIPTCLSL